VGVQAGEAGEDPRLVVVADPVAVVVDQQRRAVRRGANRDQDTGVTDTVAAVRAIAATTARRFTENMNSPFRGQGTVEKT
jgi:hypothetical protein